MSWTRRVHGPVECYSARKLRQLICMCQTAVARILLFAAARDSGMQANSGMHLSRAQSFRNQRQLDHKNLGLHEHRP
jgi:hypothetical protein